MGTKKEYWVVLERTEGVYSRIGAFTNRDRAEDVLARSVSTIAIGGTIEEVGIDAGNEMLEESKRAWMSVRDQIVNELMSFMVDPGERLERANNIAAMQYDQECSYTDILSSLTPVDGVHGGIVDVFLREIASVNIAKLMNVITSSVTQ